MHCRANEVEPRLEDVPDGGASTLGPSRGPGSRLPMDATLSNSMPVPGSSDIVDLGASVLGLSSHPRASPLPPSWR
jgi:hypothetical protein